MSKKHEEEKENTWETFLAKVVPSKHADNTSLIVLGDKKNGKGELLRKFKERSSSGTNVNNIQQEKSLVFDYSFAKVKNIHDESDPEEVHAQMSIWDIDNPDHLPGLLPLFVNSVGFHNTVYMITLDLSQPWSVMSSLAKWVDAIEKAQKEHFSKLPEEKQKQLRNKISKFTQMYVDPAKQGDPQLAEQLRQQEEHIDYNQPRMNLGVPLIIVGCKADTLTSVFSTQTVAGDRFEYLTRKLRLFCLEYGAALFFTSSVGVGGVNIDATQEYIYHRLYNFDFLHKPKATGSDTDYTFLIPSGLDSVDLIRRINPAKRFGDEELFENVFKQPSNGQPVVEMKGEDELKADDNQTLFASLKFSIQHKTDTTLALPSINTPSNMVSPRRSSIFAKAGITPPPNPTAVTAAAAAAGPDQRAVVHTFFQNLLSTGAKGQRLPARSDVQAALNNIRGTTE